MGFQIGIKDIVDIVLVAFLLYQMFKLLKRSIGWPLAQINDLQNTRY